MKLKIKYFFLLSLFFHFTCGAYGIRLKDLASLKGVRENPIWGHGLVVGLNGTGDGGGEITTKSLKRMFKNMGLNPKEEVSAKNVAAVIVSAKLPPFARVGSKIDVTISSVGDASSLGGGMLLVTPLKGGDGKVYAIAQGPVSIGGLENGQKMPTTARAVEGAIIEREVKLPFHKKKSLRFALHVSDFTTSFRAAKSINNLLGGLYAKSLDARTIDVIVPTNYKRKIVSLVSLLENVKVERDLKAKIVINERTGTIVTGGDLYLGEVAMSHQDLAIQVGGEEEGNAKPKYLYHSKEQSKLSDLVKGLNALGVSPEQMISILQALKKNGALVGEIEFI